MTLQENFYLLITVTLEETIRQKQRFRKSVAEFLSIAAALTNQELEIALARIADWMNSMSDEQIRTKWQFREKLLKSYYDMRLTGKKRLNVLKRLGGKCDNQFTFKRTWEPDEEYFLRRLLHYPIAFPVTEDELRQCVDRYFVEGVGI